MNEARKTFSQVVHRSTLRSMLNAYAAAVLLCLLLSSNAAADERPNFLIIIADDVTFSDFGFTGNPDVVTPAIDKLAEQGMVFNRMVTPGSCCSPTRHALYTGLFPVRSGAYPNHAKLRPGTKSAFKYLNDAGYRTGLQGKTHISPKSAFPYQEVAKNPDQFKATRDFITADPNQPWMLVYASHHPHLPWKEGDRSLFDADKLTIPPYLQDTPETRQSLVEYYAEINALDQQVERLMRILENTNQARNTVVVFLSEQGSNLPNAGKWSVYEKGVRAATIVRWPEKVATGSTSDALTQYIDIMPTFLELAGVDPSTIDTGCPDADGNVQMDGRSFASVLLGKSQTHREFVFAQHTTVGINGYVAPFPIRGVADKRYKLIHNLAPENVFQIGGTENSAAFQSYIAGSDERPELAQAVAQVRRRPEFELYDLDNDIYEANNLIDDAGLSEVRGQLHEQLNEWMRQQGDQGLQTELEAYDHMTKAKPE